jgi:hypothetical protein
MNKYEYRTEMATDILNYIDSNITLEDWEFRTDLEDDLYDELWIEDSVTGNGGDYYDTENNCESYLACNLDLMMEVCEEFCVDMKILLQHYHDGDLARYLDCTIRCYLLGEVLHDVLNNIWKSE